MKQIPGSKGKHSPMSDPMLRKYAKPTVDVIFKKVFGNPNDTRCLESLLSVKVIRDLEMSDKNLSIAVSEIEIAAMNDEERRFYEARLAAIRDYNSAMHNSELRGKAEGAHATRLNYFLGFVKKRFPNLLSLYRAKIFMMTDEQLEQLTFMFIDYQNQKEFEDAINALKIPDQK